MDEDKSESHALEAFEGLLESISKLEILDAYICKMGGLPKVTSILSHKRTLTSLSIHSQFTKEIVHHYAEEDFQRICSECSNLRQLSMNFPKTSVEAALPSAEFRAYMVWSNKSVFAYSTC